jgi:hypothetical protein
MAFVLVYPACFSCDVSGWWRLTRMGVTELTTGGLLRTRGMLQMRIVL